jgi:DNA-binding CsgD family transcriptional regulator
MPTSLEPEPGPGRLTPRERQVMELLIAGYTDKGIAHALGIGHDTAKHHTQRIYQKLGVPSRAAAVALILQAQIDQANQALLDAQHELDERKRILLRIEDTLASLSRRVARNTSRLRSIESHLNLTNPKNE